jgi:two-component system response regulator AtoC
MAAGLFRSDLFYRLNVVRIHVPPLRERKEDIIPLLEHFVESFNRKLHVKVRSITREAQDALVGYSWRGNVRELQNVMERAMILCTGDSITLDCLPQDIRFQRYRMPVLPDERETLSLKKASRDLERSLIAKALNRCGGNRSQAAALLEISYPSLLQKIKEYGLA